MILSQIFINGSEDLAEFSVVLIGFVFGSFLGMLIYRLPLGISLINPKRSICPKCSKQLRTIDNIPIISYLFLGGKCFNCKAKISIVYPIVEILTSIITFLLYQKLGLNINFYIITILFYLLLVLSFIDFKYKAVPDYLLLFAIVVSFFTFNFSFQNAMLFAGGFVLLDFFITFYIQNIKSKLTKNEALKQQTALGEGDIPIIAIIGGILGVKLGLVAIFLSSIFAIIPAILNNIIKKDIETPFIPFLALALFIVYNYDMLVLAFLENLLK
jgi:leader peptidase (prepilin peptidase)/N-methyltransferase